MGGAARNEGLVLTIVAALTPGVYRGLPTTQKNDSESFLTLRTPWAHPALRPKHAAPSRFLAVSLFTAAVVGISHRQKCNANWREAHAATSRRFARELRQIAITV